MISGLWYWVTRHLTVELWGTLDQCWVTGGWSQCPGDPGAVACPLMDKTRSWSQCGILAGRTKSWILCSGLRGPRACCWWLGLVPEMFGCAACGFLKLVLACGHLCPLGELQLPPTPASAFYCGLCGVLCVPFKCEFSVFPSLLGLPKVSPTAIQYQMFWGLVFLVQDFWIGELEVGFELLPVLLQL